VLGLRETPRLAFRAHESRDEPDFVAMQTDPEVRRFAGNRAWSPDEAALRFRSTFLGKPERTYGLWATIFKPEARYIGFCGLVWTNGDAHLGYYLARPYWGRGLANEAAEEFLRFAFSELRLARVLTDIESGHRRSERIAEKLGFTRIGEKEVGDAGRVIGRYELMRPHPQALRIR
jgi:ribosomal-protein-alanine N-acetyltransferase